MNPHKTVLARWFRWMGVEWLLRRVLEALWRPHLRVVNYHDVPQDRATDFERQLEFFRRHFIPATPDDLDGLLDGRWDHDRPGLILTFDDGFRSHAEVVAPRLEAFGFVGWFFVPSAFSDVAIPEQLSWAHAQKIFPARPKDGARVAMTWEQIRKLDETHVVGCHTMNHRRLAAALSPAELDEEIPQAKSRLEEELGREVPDFCWVGGEEWAYSASAGDAIRRAGFRRSFMTNNALLTPECDPLQIQRTNVEAHFPDFVTAFQLSGILDLLYWPKRRRVNRLTTSSAR